MSQPTGENVIAAVFEILHRGGWVGVDLFFVLSGFLVTGLLLQEFAQRSRIDAGRFLLRRAFKIYPAFWACLVFAVLCRWLSGEPVTRHSVLAELLFGQGYVLPVFNHTWSLAVEEYFYLLIAAILASMAWLNRGKRPAKAFARLPKIAFGIGLTLLLWRIANVFAFQLRAIDNVFITHLRFDSLMCGAFVAYFYHCHRERFLQFCRSNQRVLIVAGIVGFSPACFIAIETSTFLPTIGLTQFYLAAACLLCVALAAAPPTGRAANATAALGRHSYGIYLWHMPVFAWLMPAVAQLLGTESWVAQTTIYVVLSIGVGVMLTRVIEIPFLTLRDRLVPPAPSNIQPASNVDPSRAGSPSTTNS